PASTSGSRVGHHSRAPTGGAVPWRSIERRLAPLRTLGRVHQSEAQSAVAPPGPTPGTTTRNLRPGVWPSALVRGRGGEDGGSCAPSAPSPAVPVVLTRTASCA